MSTTATDLGQCIGCWNPATIRFTLRSGHVARLCVPCDRNHPCQRVYFIRGGDLVKIGHSRNVKARLRSHQSGSPVPLEVWHAVEGGPELERELHGRFAGDRSHGEWFHVSDAIRSYVEGER